jgi:hypothetical protein
MSMNSWMYTFSFTAAAPHRLHIICNRSQTIGAGEMGQKYGRLMASEAG